MVRRPHCGREGEGYSGNSTYFFPSNGASRIAFSAAVGEAGVRRHAGEHNVGGEAVRAGGLLHDVGAGEVALALLKHVHHRLRHVVAAGPHDVGRVGGRRVKGFGMNGRGLRWIAIGPETARRPLNPPFESAGAWSL